MLCNWDQWCATSRELISLESCTTGDGPRPPACRHSSRALQCHEPWPGRSSAVAPWHRPSPLRPTTALLQNGSALRLIRRNCVSMHPIALRNRSHPGSTAAVWQRHGAARVQQRSWGSTPRVPGLRLPYGISLVRGTPPLDTGNLSTSQICGNHEFKG